MRFKGNLVHCHKISGPNTDRTYSLLVEE